MKNVWRALIEVGFIIFLFCSNLLMGEFERSGVGVKKGVVWVIEDVFTIANFEIGATAGLIGYVFLNFSEEILGKLCLIFGGKKSNCAPAIGPSKPLLF